MKVMIGALIIKDNQVLLVQDKNNEKWNLPSKDLQPHETVIDGVKRVIRQELGCDINIKDLATIANNVEEDDVFVQIIFKAELLSEKVEINLDEILDAKWFYLRDVKLFMDDKLNYSYFLQGLLADICN